MGKRRQAETATTNAQDAAISAPEAADAGRRRQDQRGGAADQASAATPEEALRHEIMFAALNSATYHSMRETFLANAHRWAMAIQALAATAAFAAITSTLPGSAAVWLSMFVAFAAIFTLVWNPSERARTHHDLRRRFYEIHARAEAAATEDELRAIRRDMRLIYADEPPGYNVVKAQAYNSAIENTYPPEDAQKHKISIPPWRRIVANVWPSRGWESA